MLPWAAEVLKNRLSKEDPEANCLPTGIPRGSPYPWRIVQTPTHYFILFEGNIHSFRQIFMNAKHPDDPDPTWYGHSIGHWEGNTLVVDTVGFNDKSWFDDPGHPHSEELRVTERFQRRDFGHLTVQVTFDDPKAYTKPWSATVPFDLLPDTELIEPAFFVGDEVHEPPVGFFGLVPARQHDGVPELAERVVRPVGIG